MKRMREKSGLTLVEILTVLAIIALLVGILIPAVSVVKDAAKNVRQSAQFTTIGLALEAFKSDPELFGDYPPSYYGNIPIPPATAPLSGVYCGSQKLAEALLGWDLLGFHPDSAWRLDGRDALDMIDLYDPTGNLSLRRGPYLETGTQYAFKPRDLYAFGSYAGLPGMDRYLLCDTFGRTKVTLPDGTTANAGTPILYYRADSGGNYNDPSRVDPAFPRDNRLNVYNCLDNQTLILAKEEVEDPGGTRPDFDVDAFYSYIEDPKITALSSPYNPSSYILISAGADGAYGTDDDIRNFGN